MNGRRAKKLRRMAAALVKIDHQPMRAKYQALKRAHMLIRPTLAQRPKPEPERNRKRLASIKPTWPRSKDQRAQSRPPIVQRPLRALAARWLETAPRNDKGERELTERQKNTLRALSRGLPKHQIDAAALRG